MEDDDDGKASSSSSSSSSSSKSFTYGVFLSFRGVDTRETFSAHLDQALRNAGINVFMDYKELERGGDLAPELVQGIKNSRILMVVFSKSYASSRWCLNELEMMMECRKRGRQTVVPVFYHVDPSDVRHQRGSFAHALARFSDSEEHKDKVAGWRKALTEVSSISGFPFSTHHHQNEAEFVKGIVKWVVEELSYTNLFITEYPVGMDSREEEIRVLLERTKSADGSSNDVRIIGICGIGGIGKTTTAKAIYNQYFHSFEAKSFLENVREVSQHHKGMEQLQEQFLSDVFRTMEVKIHSVARGKKLIEERHCGKKVLLVLDDVDEVDQFNSIVRSREWFGTGSRIIITTRNKDLLEQVGADEVCLTPEMNGTEALELFSWHAFGRSDPEQDFVAYSKEIVRYCQGLPLALEVLGGALFRQKEPQWRHQLKKLRKIPEDKIQEKLRISYDALSGFEDKDIFLDVSCFLVGMDSEYVVRILDGCGFSGVRALEFLGKRCLLSINESNKLMMHDLLRDMGREIVRQEFPEEPEKRSRLWLGEDVINILRKKKGTEAIRGLKLTMPSDDDRIVETKAFWKLQNLRLLHFNHVKLKTGYEEDLFEELRWLYWHDFPLEFVPDGFHLGEVVIVDMQRSNLRQVWKNPKFLKKLKFLDLSHSQHLKETPDFLLLPNLKELKLKGCTSLVEIHDSLPQLSELVYADFEDCKLLESLPSDFGKLKSLKTLVLDGCSKFHTYPENMGDLKSLTTLRAKNTAVVLFPGSFSRLKKLKNFSLCGNLGFLGRESLKKTNLLRHSSKGFSLLSLLSFLNLSSSFVSHDHFSIEKWHQLIDLIHKAQRSDLPNSSSSGLLLMPPEHDLSHDFLQDDKVLQECYSHAWNGIFVHGDQIPVKYVYRQEGSSVDVDVPDEIDGLLYGLEVCCVYSCDADYVASPGSHPTIHFTNGYTKHEDTFKFKAIPNSEYNLFKAAFLCQDIRMGPGDKLRIKTNLGNKTKVRMTGAILMTLDGLDLEEGIKRTTDDQSDNIYESIKEMVAFLRDSGDKLIEIVDRLSKLEVDGAIGSYEATTARDAFTSSSSGKSFLGTIPPPREAAHERSSAPPSSSGKLKEKMQVDLLSISSAKGLTEPIKGKKGKAKEKEAEVLEQEESEKASSSSNSANSTTTTEGANLEEASHIENLEREDKLDGKKRRLEEARRVVARLESEIHKEEEISSNGARKGRGGCRSCCCSWWSRP